MCNNVCTADYPRAIEEINETLDIFKKQKENIYATINNFDLLTPASKKDLIYYLDGFFETINKSEGSKIYFC